MPWMRCERFGGAPRGGGDPVVRRAMVFQRAGRTLRAAVRIPLAHRTAMPALRPYEGPVRPGERTLGRGGALQRAQPAWLSNALRAVLERPHARMVVDRRRGRVRGLRRLPHHSRRLAGNQAVRKRRPTPRLAPLALHFSEEALGAQLNSEVGQAFSPAKWVGPQESAANDRAPGIGKRAGFCCLS